MLKYMIILFLVYGLLQKAVSDDPEYHNDDYVDVPEEGEPEEEEVRPAGPPPSISTVPQVIEASPGERKTLPCVVNDNRYYAVMWKYGNSTLFVDQVKVTHNIRLTRFDDRLIIEDIKSEDVGLYTCEVASNPPVKVEHILDCPTCPPRSPSIIKVQQYPSENPVENSSFNLFCRAVGPPQPRVKWLRRNRIVSNDYQVEFRSIKKEDSGEYICSADNGHGVVTRSVEVHVLYSPEIKVEDNKVVGNVGHDASLVCEVRAAPGGKVSWRRNGRVLSGNNRISIKKDKHKHVLHITKVMKSDFGTYTCSAQNDIGNNTKDIILLDGTLIPVVEVENTKVHSGVGYEATLVCKVSGPSQAGLSVSWKYNGVPVKQDERFTLKRDDEQTYILDIRDITEKDLGNYTCVAENDIGMASRNIEVTGKPTKGKLVEIVPDGQNRIVRWSVESRAPVQKHALKYRKIDSDKWINAYPIVDKPQEGNVYLVEYTIPDLNIGGYEVIVSSENGHGWSDDSEPFKIDIDYRSEGQRTDGGNNCNRCRISVFLLIISLTFMGW